jgi:hypothetical protein
MELTTTPDRFVTDTMALKYYESVLFTLGWLYKISGGKNKGLDRALVV